MDERSRKITAIIIGGVGLLAVLVLAVFLLSDGDDEAAETTTTTAETTTTTAETTTTAAETTTTAAETTTTAAETTTTAAETTTTTLAPEPLVLADDGIGGIQFGATPGDTIAYATAVLGPPDHDSGWIDSFSVYGTCPPPVVRGVEWGTAAGGFGSAFTLLFTQAETTHHPAGEHFFGYYYFGGTPSLATAEGVTYGTTNAAAQAAIPTIDIFEDPFDPGGGAWDSDVDESDMNLLWGFSSSVDPGGTLTSVNGGSSCGE
jgi:hypothetical protein